MFKIHGLNTTYVPCKYGQIVRIERLGRDWKGKYPFNIYDRNFRHRDKYTNQDDGRWKSQISLDLDPERKVTKTSYGYYIEVTSDQLKLIKDAPADVSKIPPCPDVHRPSSTVRELVKLAKFDKSIDLEWCNNWLKIYEANKSQSSPPQAKNKENDNEKENSKNQEKVKENTKSGKQEIDNP